MAKLVILFIGLIMIYLGVTDKAQTIGQILITDAKALNSGGIKKNAK